MNNNLTKLTEIVGGQTFNTTYTYDKDNRPTFTTLTNTARKQEVNYDSLGRAWRNIIHTGSTTYPTTVLFKDSTNILTANQSSFETSAEMYTSVRYAREQSDDWKKHGSFSAKLTKTDATNQGYTWHRRTISGYPVGTPFTASAVVFIPAGSWYIGKPFTIRIRFAGGANPESSATIQTYTLQQGENFLEATRLLDFADRTMVEFFLWDAEGYAAPVGAVFYTDNHQLEPSSQATAWMLNGHATPLSGPSATTVTPYPTNMTRTTILRPLPSPAKPSGTTMTN